MPTSMCGSYSPLFWKKYMNSFLGISSCISVLILCINAHTPTASYAEHVESVGCRTGYQVWMGAICGAIAVGLVGVLPLLLVASNTKLFKDGKLTATLRTMLGFACGGLLANAFLHLLPEAYGTLRKAKPGEVHFMGIVPVMTNTPHGFNEYTYIGLWVILGIGAFILLEKLVNAYGDSDVDVADDDTPSACVEKSATDSCSCTASQQGDKNSTISSRPGSTSASACSSRRNSNADDGRFPAGLPKRVSLPTLLPDTIRVDPAGYLNLLVNALDNFTHGLAIAGSFCVSDHVGIMTTVAIVIHEIPHEIGDYFILVRSGFSKKQAIVSQFFTSAGGICGAVFGLLCAKAERTSIWILPFTAGGFMYIALVSLIPDMDKEETPGYSSWRDVCNIAGGIVLVGSTQLF